MSSHMKCAYAGTMPTVDTMQTNCIDFVKSLDDFSTRDIIVLALFDKEC